MRLGITVKYATQIDEYDNHDEMLHFYDVNQNAGMYLLDLLKYGMEKGTFRKTMNLLLDYGLDMDYKDERGHSLRDYANRFDYVLAE